MIRTAIAKNHCCGIRGFLGLLQASISGNAVFMVRTVLAASGRGPNFRFKQNCLKLMFDSDKFISESASRGKSESKIAIPMPAGI